MGKTSVLVLSIISLALSVLAILVIPTEDIGSIVANIIIATIILWIVMVFAVFRDAKRRNKPTAYVALALFLGGLGGLIYYVLNREGEDQVTSPPMSEATKKSTRIFSIILAVVFGLALLLSIPFSRDGVWRVPLTATWTVLLAIAIYIAWKMGK